LIGSPYGSCRCNMEQVSVLSLSANFDQEAHYCDTRGSLAVTHSQMTHSLHALSSQRCIQERHVEAGHQVPLKLASERSYYSQGQNVQRGKKVQVELGRVHVTSRPCRALTKAEDTRGQRFPKRCCKEAGSAEYERSPILSWTLSALHRRTWIVWGLLSRTAC
jgi:hypothetical protein